VRDGYEIEPHLPLRGFSVMLPDVGIEYAPGHARGYLRPDGRRLLKLTVALPAGLRTGPAAAFVNGRRVASRRGGGRLTFSARARAGRALDWAVARP
jgi:hypothetical protein